MSEILNAKITSTNLGFEDHGIMTCFLGVEGDGWGCGFGGYSLDGPVKDDNDKFLCRKGTAYGMEFIKKILVTVGVEKWEDLIGKYIRCETEGLGGGITRIGHITKNLWFNPKELFKDL